jgi:hypothetical protein
MRATKRGGRSYLAAACLFAAVMPLWAPPAFSRTPTTSDIVGTVTDGAGAVAPKAAVTAKFLDEETVRTEVAKDTSEYAFH